MFSCLVQELRVFLEGEGVLALCPEWQRLQPANGTLLDGVARLPKQLLGEHLPTAGQSCRALRTCASHGPLRSARLQLLLFATCRH